MLSLLHRDDDGVDVEDAHLVRQQIEPVDDHLGDLPVRRARDLLRLLLTQRGLPLLPWRAAAAHHRLDGDPQRTADRGCWQVIRFLCTYCSFCI